MTELLPVLDPRYAGQYRDRLLSCAIGNSICWFGAYGVVTAYMHDQRSEVAAANILFPLSYFRPIVTPVAESAGITSGVDACGTMGFPGEKTDKIYRDIINIMFPAHDTAGFIPEMIYLLALYENDIAFDYDINGIKTRVNNIITTLRAKYPGVVLHLGTSRADSRLTDAGKISAAMDMRAWMLAKDNNRDIFVTDFWSGSYSNPANPASITLQWTDGNVHPNSNGAYANGRLIAATNRRISRASPKFAKKIQSQNFGFLGSVAAATTGFTGTLATSLTAPTALAGAGEAVLTAGNPGPQNIKWTPTVAGAGNLLLLRMSKTTGLPTGRVSGVVNARINSGAAYIQDIYPTTRLNGSPIYTGAAKGQNSSGYAGSFVDGDVLEFLTPDMALPGTFTAVQHNINIIAQNTGNLIDIDIFGAGYSDWALTP